MGVLTPSLGQNPRAWSDRLPRGLARSLRVAGLHVPLMLCQHVTPVPQEELRRHTLECFSDVSPGRGFSHKDKQTKMLRFAMSHPEAPGTPYKEPKKPQKRAGIRLTPSDLQKATAAPERALGATASFGKQLEKRSFFPGLPGHASSSTWPPSLLPLSLRNPLPEVSRPSAEP